MPKKNFNSLLPGFNIDLSVIMFNLIVFQLLMEKFKKHQEKALAKVAEQKKEREEAEKRRKERLAKKAEEEKKQMEQMEEQPKIKELTDEEAEKLQMEIDEVCSCTYCFSKKFIHSNTCPCGR